MLADAAVLDDAAADAGPLAAFTRAERDRLAPDLASVSLVSGQLDGGLSTISRRQAAKVGVVGGGRVGGAVATLLAAAGVGHLVVDDPATCQPADCGPAVADSGATRAQAAPAAVHRASESTRTTALRASEQFDVVVLAPAGDRGRTRPCDRRRPGPLRHPARERHRARGDRGHRAVRGAGRDSVPPMP